MQPEHLQAYCHEFEFRWNRRRARARGLLFYRLMQQAVNTKPTTYRQLVKNPSLDKDRVDKPTPPDPCRGRCRSRWTSPTLSGHGASTGRLASDRPRAGQIEGLLRSMHSASDRGRASLMWNTF